MHRARAFCNKESVYDALELLNTNFRENGCSIKQIRQALILAVRTSKPKGKPTSFALLPYVQITYDWFSGILAKYNIKFVGLLPRKISTLLCPVNYDLLLRTPGVYSILCGCGQVYIRHTGRSIETRIKEHHWHIWLGHPDTLVLAELGFSHNHVIKFQDIQIFAIVPSCMEQLIREAVELELNLSDMNRDDGLTFSRSWKPLLLVREGKWPTQ